DLLPDLIDLEVAEQRLRVLHVEVRSDLRAEALELVRRREPRAVPGGLVRAAPGQLLVQSQGRIDVAVEDVRRATRKGARRLLCLRVLRDARRQARRPERPRGRDAYILNLRVDA